MHLSNFMLWTISGSQSNTQPTSVDIDAPVPYDTLLFSAQEIRHLKTVSLSLDDKLPVADSVKQPAAIRGRRAFSMDVHAGLDGSPSLVA